MALLQDVISKGTLAARPAASTNGKLYVVTDDDGGTFFRDNGSAWEQVAPGVNEAGGGAGSSAPYITYAADATLTNEKVLGVEIFIADTLAARPAAGLNGRFYLATDDNGGTLYRDNGTTWVKAARGANEQLGAPASADYVVFSAQPELTAEKVLGTDVFMAGTLVSRPAASIVGRLYFATDEKGGTTYRDSGTAWVQIAAGVAGEVSTTLYAGGPISPGTTAASVVASLPNLKWFAVIADPYNGDGNDIAVGVDASTTPTILQPGDSFTWNVDNGNKVYAKKLAGSPTLSYQAGN